MLRGVLTTALLLSLVIFFGCKRHTSFADRLQTAGGADALKTECLGFITAYEASLGTQRNWHADQTNFPPTIAALQPRVVQVGRQGDVVLVHLGFVNRPPPFGIYVAPRGCPSDFAPERPLGSKVSKLAEGVFEYADWSMQIHTVLFVIAGLAGLILLAVWQGFIPPPHASTLIRIRGGLVYVRRGIVRPDAKEHITEIMRGVGVTKGFIAITPGNWVAFSRGIPTAVHQRLRNVLLNQWA